MKNLYAVVAMAAVIGVASGQAQTTNFTHGLNLALSGALIPSGALVNNASLSGNTNPVSFVDLEIINGTTNYERWIGQIGETTNLFLKEGRHTQFSPALDKDKFMLVFDGTGQVGTSSNATLLVSGTDQTSIRTIKIGGHHTNETEIVTNNTFIAKIQGVWVEDGWK